jgi:hypothetical protein
MVLTSSLFAQDVEHKNLDFPVKSEELLKGEHHFFFSIMSPRKLAIRFPEVFELDSLSLLQENNVMAVLTKSMVVVSKPVGFFEEKQMTDERFFKHISGEQEVKKQSPDSFQIQVPGKGQHQYKVQTFFDSDDLSTLPNSRIVSAVASAKKLDVISQSASTIMFSEKTNFSKYLEGAVSVSSYISLKENKTLVITYNLWAVKKPHVSEDILKRNFLNEVNSTKLLIESFK